MPRQTAGKAALMSCQLGMSPVTFLVKISRFSPPASRLRMISPKPKTPIAMGPMPTPSMSSAMPKL